MYQHFRIAKHTTSIEKIKSFYCDLLSFEELGHFEQHQGYNGIFLGMKDMNWHLEFTESDTLPDRLEDDDDMMVLYCSDIKHYERLQKQLNHLDIIQAKNDYWNKNGFMIQDPDGNKIVICKHRW